MRKFQALLGTVAMAAVLPVMAQVGGGAGGAGGVGGQDATSEAGKPQPGVDAGALPTGSGTVTPAIVSTTPSYVAPSDTTVLGAGAALGTVSYTTSWTNLPAGVEKDPNFQRHMRLR